MLGLRSMLQRVTTWIAKARPPKAFLWIGMKIVIDGFRILNQGMVHSQTIFSKAGTMHSS